MGWWRRRGKFSKALIVVGGLFVVIVIISSANGGDDTTTTTTAASVASATDTTVASTLATTPTTTQAPAPTEPPTTVTTVAPQWVKVAELAGKAQKTGDVFELTGAEARLSYDVKGEFVMAGIYVMKDGTNLDSDGGFPVVTATEAGSDTTRLVLDPGKYYLVVNSANPYTVTIEEQR